MFIAVYCTCWEDSIFGVFICILLVLDLLICSPSLPCAVQKSFTIPFYSAKFLSPVVTLPLFPADLPGSTFPFVEMMRLTVVPHELSPSVPISSSISPLPGAVQL